MQLNPEEMRAVLTGRRSLAAAIRWHEADERNQRRLHEMRVNEEMSERDRRAVAGALDERLSQIMSQPVEKQRRMWVNPRPAPDYEIDWGASK